MLFQICDTDWRAEIRRGTDAGRGFSLLRKRRRASRRGKAECPYEEWEVSASLLLFRLSHKSRHVIGIIIGHQLRGERFLSHTVQRL